MMQLKCWIFLLAALNPLVASASDTVLIRVTGDPVNLRAKPSLESETFEQQVHKGDYLVARSFQEGWVEIIPPTGVFAWVHGEFLDGNTVNASELNFRSGPGINYSILGRLDRGDTVVKTGSFGEWIQIEPPPDTSIFISRDHIEVYVEPEPEPVIPKPVVHPTPRPVPSSRQAERIEPGSDEARAPGGAVPSGQAPSASINLKNPYGLMLIPLEGQGKEVARSGKLKKVGFVFGKTPKFKLVRDEDGRDILVCYIHGNQKQMLSFLGKNLQVEGPQYWVKGVRDPVVVPKKIKPLDL